jgi:hypothetical protein
MQDVSEKKAKAVDELLSMFTKKADGIKRRLQVMPGMPKCMPAECRTLWHETVGCFILGYDYAALSTSGAFVESIFEKGIPLFREAKGQAATPAPQGLANRINVAKKIGLVTDDEAVMLDEFRDLVRNPFSHGNLDRLANLYSEIKGGTYVSIEGGQVKGVYTLNDDDIRDLSKATVKPRVKLSSRKIAPRVLGWIGIWAGDCAKRVWLPTK